MNIIDNRGKFNLVRFDEIKVGDCFEYHGLFYLKTGIFRDSDDDYKYNAINLNNNCFYFFYDTISIHKLNTNLCISYYSMEE